MGKQNSFAGSIWITAAVSLLAIILYLQVASSTWCSLYLLNLNKIDCSHFGCRENALFITSCYHIISSLIVFSPCKGLTMLCYYMHLHKYILNIVCSTACAQGATFVIKNQCPYTVWAAASPGAGKALGQGQTWSFNVAAGTTQARIWGRTGCSFDASGRGSCNTGDCGELLNCQGYGSVPATLFEYALNQYQNQDFYDISPVDGFNIPLSISPSNSNCKKIGCTSNINSACPSELKVTGGCKSACTAFNTPQYCCTGAYLNNCSHTNYSKFFKGQCPQAYSYAKDDATSTFTCPSGTANYNIVFCG